MTAVLEAVTDCGVPACARSVKVVKWQLCGMHYQRAYNSGMLDAGADLADVHATVAEWVAPPRRASVRKPKPPKPDEQPTIESFLASTEHPTVPDPLEYPSTIPDTREILSSNPATAATSIVYEPAAVTVAVPLILSAIPDDTDITEAVTGARWLGLPLTDAGRQIAGVLQAADDDGIPVYDTVGVEVPRRSTKTTSINATLLGRCLNRPGYLVGSTAQDGLRARHKLREVMGSLQRAGFEDVGLGTLYWSNGVERIEFANGAEWRAIPPDPTAFRSMAYDCVLIDEAGELEPDKANALQAGILPTMDTRPQSQLVVAGTPGTVRAGLLWDTLAELDAGTAGTGGVVYAAGPRDVFADLSNPDAPVYNLELLERVHPGISAGLTTTAKIMKRLPKLGLVKWSAEYLCIWPSHAGTSALDVDAWHECEAADGLPPRPDKVGLGWDCDPDGTRAALVAAWRDERQRVHLEVLACRPGSDWVPAVTKAAVAKHGRPAVYDAIGQNLEVAERMQRNRVRTRPLRMRDLIGAAARLEKVVAARAVVHYGQPDLTDAVEGVTWRPAGTDGRLFARKASASSAACIVAASVALWDYDTTQRPGQRQGIRSTVTAGR